MALLILKHFITKGGGRLYDAALNTVFECRFSQKPIIGHIFLDVGQEISNGNRCRQPFNFFLLFEGINFISHLLDFGVLPQSRIFGRSIHVVLGKLKGI